MLYYGFFFTVSHYLHWSMRVVKQDELDWKAIPSLHLLPPGDPAHPREAWPPTNAPRPPVSGGRWSSTAREEIQRTRKNCSHIDASKTLHTFVIYQANAYLFVFFMNRNSANKSARALLFGGKVGIWSYYTYCLDRSGVLLNFFPPSIVMWILVPFYTIWCVFDIFHYLHKRLW